MSDPRSAPSFSLLGSPFFQAEASSQPGSVRLHTWEETPGQSEARAKLILKHERLTDLTRCRAGTHLSRRGSFAGSPALNDVQHGGGGSQTLAEKSRRPCVVSRGGAAPFTFHKSGTLETTSAVGSVSAAYRLTAHRRQQETLHRQRLVARKLMHSGWLEPRITVELLLEAWLMMTPPRPTVYMKRSVTFARHKSKRLKRDHLTNRTTCVTSVPRKKHGVG